jgi:two-component system, OmpR family, phosphate regulon sensor histidine kinase PhoR
MAIFLMVVSMLLLAAFQVFWLRKEYNEQKSLLLKEADILFKNTIQALEDSVIQKKITRPIRKAFALDSQATAPKAASKQRNFTFRYTHNSTPPEPPPKAINPEKSAKRSARSEALDLFFIQTAARMSQLSGVDTTLSKSKLHDVLRKTNLEDIRAIKVNSIGNLDITKLTVADTTPQGKSEIIIVKSHQPSDTLQRMLGRMAKVVMFNRPNRDSILSFTPLSGENNKIRISVIERTEKREVSTQKKPKIQAAENQFIIRLGNDSLKIQDIQRAYVRQIQKSKIDLPFHVVRQAVKPAPEKQEVKSPTESNQFTLSTSAIATTIPFGSTYSAVFSDYHGFLLKKILPQSLFSFFLLTIMGLAFGTIYQNLRRQHRLTELKNDFISNVTHELKTPIATVSVAIEALQNFGVSQNPEQTKEYLEISKSELNRLTLLVDKVLKMATFEQQGLTLSLQTVDWSETVQLVLNSMKLQFEKYGAKVDFDKTGVSFSLPADKIHLTNVVYNLLDNALKYTKTQPLISLHLKETETDIRLSVSDNGIGIPSEYQGKVFDKFFRVPTGNTHDVKGYGLGLSYVSSVVKQHHGRIEVESEVGKGSIFTIIIPKQDNKR